MLSFFVYIIFLLYLYKIKNNDMKKKYFVLMSICILFLSCSHKNKNYVNSIIVTSLQSKINLYNNGKLKLINYEDIKYSIVNDSIRYYVLNYNSTDEYGFKEESFTYGYFNMNNGYDVTDFEDSTDDNSDRFMNTEIY